MTYLVFDLEWNIAGRGDETPASERRRMPFEIIEIGAVRLNECLDVVGTFQEDVRPILYTKLQYHISKVTHRTQESLAEGGPFSEVFGRFLDFAGDDAVLASWGTADTDVLRQNLRYHTERDLPWQRAMDLQWIFSEFEDDGRHSQQRSVEYALDALDIPKDLPFHRAEADATYAARVFRRLAADHFPERRDFPVSFWPARWFYDPTLDREQHFTVKTDPVAHPQTYLEQYPYRCPSCDRPLRLPADLQVVRRKRKWRGTSECDRHGTVRITAQVQKQRDGKEVYRFDLKLPHDSQERRRS